LDEEKTAQNAERHADVIARNIRRSVEQRPLKSYKPRTGPLVISLGPRDAILTFNGHSVFGPIPGVLKWAIEAHVIDQYRPPI
jgi:NADH dehydrogenase FAD-containing subunit